MAEKNKSKQPAKPMPVGTTSKSMSRGMVKHNPNRGDSVVAWSSNSAGYAPKKEKNR